MSSTANQIKAPLLLNPFCLLVWMDTAGLEEACSTAEMKDEASSTISIASKLKGPAKFPFHINMLLKQWKCVVSLYCTHKH